RSTFSAHIRSAWSAALFPCTTLFRSSLGARRTHSGGSVSQGGHADAHDHLLLPRENKGTKVSCLGRAQQPPRHAVITASNEGGRSEEHTSEFQSRENLVCRLLLEKKK